MKILFLLLNLISIQVIAQNPAYYGLIRKADSLFKLEEYNGAALLFSSAFATNGGLGLVQDRYDAARTRALAGNADSAFFQLNRIVSKGNFSDIDFIRSDSSLNQLHTDERWHTILDNIQTNKANDEKMHDKALILELDSIFIDDQQYRIELNNIEKEHGKESEQARKLLQIIKMKDSVNVLKVRKILDTNGWPGREVVGEKGGQTLFAVLQHADTGTQKKYLPLLKKAVEDGKVQPYYLVFLEDRLALSEGRKQTYGTQIIRTEKGYEIAPIEDEENVNVRRKLIELNSLEAYAKEFNIHYRLPLRWKRGFFMVKTMKYLIRVAIHEKFGIDVVFMDIWG